jgi:hypothetical protein
VAAILVLLAAALLASLDFVSRSPGDPPGTPVVLIAVVLVAAALYAAFADWHHVRPMWRLLPALGAVAAVLAAITWAGSASTTHASIGLTAMAALVLAYVGFVLPPGSAFFFSPLVVLVVLVAHLREKYLISLALPLVAVPTAALLGELVSALTDRTVRTADRFISRQEHLARLEDVLRRFSRPASLTEAASEVALAAQEIFDVARPRSCCAIRGVS